MVKPVFLNKLSSGNYGSIICYPNFEAGELRRRIIEMEKLGVESLDFKGEKTVNNVPILGKGCESIVILAYTKTGRVALKIRRTDSNRTCMEHEAEMLRTANSVGVGPKLFGYTKNLLMMEFVYGEFLGRWIKTLEISEYNKMRVSRVLTDVLEKCWKLDEKGLDHGELSWAPKHIIIQGGNSYIIDYESASIARRVSNVSSVCNFLFIAGNLPEIISTQFKKADRNVLFSVLKLYKKKRSRSCFEKVLKACSLKCQSSYLNT